MMGILIPAITLKTRSLKMAVNCVPTLTLKTQSSRMGVNFLLAVPLKTNCFVNYIESKEPATT